MLRRDIAPMISHWLDTAESGCNLRLSSLPLYIVRFVLLGLLLLVFWSTLSSRRPVQLEGGRVTVAISERAFRPVLCVGVCVFFFFFFFFFFKYIFYPGICIIYS